MNRGGKFLWLAAPLVVAGCASGGQLNIRPIKDPLAAARSGQNSYVAEGRGQLALGNVGLALEAFRAASRAEPSNFEALAGIAACYVRMGRFDLARTNYEAALAIAPRNPVLLNSFAASLEVQGLTSEAAAVRAEAAANAAVPSPKLAQASATGTTQWSIQAPLNSSVTVQLPPARPPAAIDEAKLAAADLAVLTDEQAPQAPQQPAANQGPRLQRLSPGVVALVTVPEPVWGTTVLAQSRQSVTVRFVPLKSEVARPNVRVLNAARSQGLAADTREVLLDRGWRKIAIGDASEVRESSVVLYPASRKTLGRALAAQFGFPSMLSTRGELVVLLGRDAPEAIRQNG